MNSDLQIASPQVIVDIDRDRASALSLTAAQVEASALRRLRPGQIATIYSPTDTYYVILELLPKYQFDPNSLGMLYLHSSNGQLVPLNAVAKMRTESDPLTGDPSGPVAGGDHLLQPRARRFARRCRRPRAEAGAGIAARHISGPRFQGMARGVPVLHCSGMGVLLADGHSGDLHGAGYLYESFIHPITILSGLPSAGFGALVTLLIFHKELNIYSFVGIIMLIGIVKKNAIMMIDFALEAQRRARAPADAIYEACLVRFRPIMMTTMAALMGTLPIALGLGAGGEARRPLGLAVVGGLVVSQLLTLYITPVFYIYMERVQGWLSKRKKKPAITPQREAVTVG